MKLLHLLAAVFYVGDEDLFECHVLNALNARARAFIGVGKIRHKRIGCGDRQSALARQADDSRECRQFDSQRNLEPEAPPAVEIEFLVHRVDNSTAINESDLIGNLFHILSVV